MKNNYGRPYDSNDRPFRFAADVSIVTKLCHMFDGDPDLGNSVRLWRPLPPKFGGPKHEISARFRT